MEWTECVGTYDCEVNSPSLSLSLSPSFPEQTTRVDEPPPLQSPPLAPSLPHPRPRARGRPTTTCTKNLFTSLVAPPNCKSGRKWTTRDDGFEMQMSDFGVCLLAICKSEPVSVDMWNLGRHVCGRWVQGSAVDSFVNLPIGFEAAM